MCLDRQKFLNDLSANPRHVLSPVDDEIQRQCDQLIRPIPCADEMLSSKGKPLLFVGCIGHSQRALGNLSAMKAVLSYSHSLFASKRELSDAEYYYVIPLVLCHYPSLAKFVFESVTRK
jgi:hypothetical protein